EFQEANLRVSCLKGARLVGCNLRAAVLAGSDLENADLTGCDLQHANLRGANVVNCVFQDLRTPLHMAQTMDAF
uniref:Pentapeptide repeat-containing protein n=1 Tax=Macrostomum lignano TaxID=282301 RepID=A0A1I8GVI2_9PLAT